MKFRRALLALVISTMLSAILIQIILYLFAGNDFFDIELNYIFYTAWAVCDIIPAFCWLVVLLPILFLTSFFDRLPWYLSGIFGLLIGAIVTILYKALTLFIGIPWQPLLIIIWALNVGVQFVIVSLTKIWFKTALPISVKSLI